MIISAIKTGNECVSKPYPKLMVSKDGQYAYLVILFSSPRCGVVVGKTGLNANYEHEIGELLSGSLFDTSCFKDYDGSVELCND